MSVKTRKKFIYISLIIVVALFVVLIRDFLLWTSEREDKESISSSNDISDIDSIKIPNDSVQGSNDTNESQNLNGENVDRIIHDEETISEVLNTLSQREIRVLLYDTNYMSVYHNEIRLTSDVDYQVVYDDSIKEYMAGEVATFMSGSYENDYSVYVKTIDDTGKIELLSVERAQGTPKYSGCFEITQRNKGLCIINEVDIETYLYSVVPSEMPSYYPLEALKAQAISARTYAYERMLYSDLTVFNADVSDSSNHQVYNNIEMQESTNRAVDETKGIFMFYKDAPAKTYYYSTSCGIGADEEVWSMSDISYLNQSDISVSGYEQLLVEAGNMGDAYQSSQDTIDYSDETVFREWITLSSEETDSFEKNENYFRWSYTVKPDTEVIYGRILARKDSGDGTITCSKGTFVNPGHIINIEVVKRADSGYVQTILIEGKNADYEINGQNNIRYILCDTVNPIIINNGSQAKCDKLIPSAFFIVTNEVENGMLLEYTLTGGGHGHGVGMSQNGARNMAEQGMNCIEILEFFYQGTLLIEVT